jgi:uncharacterized RDD family membrane protein YckC
MTLNCPHCANEYFIETKFCDQCGYNVNPDLTITPVCPTCNATYPPNTWYCIEDGSKLIRADDRQQQPGYNQLFQFYDMGYPKASLGSRFVAALLDGLITVGLAIPAILAFVAGMNKQYSYYSRSSAGVYFLLAILLYLVPLAYAFVKDGLGHGQSWGKRSMDLMVVNLDNNTPCDKGKSAVRTLISGLTGVIPFVGWLIEPIMVLATNDGRKLGDKAANTQVIEKKYYN